MHLKIGTGQWYPIYFFFDVGFAHLTRWRCIVVMCQWVLVGVRTGHVSSNSWGSRPRYRNVPKMAPGPRGVGEVEGGAGVTAVDRQRLFEVMQGIKVMIKEVSNDK